MSVIEIALMQIVRIVWTIVLCEAAYALFEVGIFLGAIDWSFFCVGVSLVCCSWHVLVRAYRNARDVCYPDRWIADLVDADDIGRGPLYW